MPDELNVKISPSELTPIVVSVIGTMMDMEVEESATPWSPNSGRITAAVQLVGDWIGALLIECDRAQACRFAGRFLSVDPPDAIDDNVRDVVGELASMIGGNLKCVLTRGIRLSMPSVVDGSDYSLRICGAEVCARLGFECAEGTFWVTALATPS